MTKKLEQIFGFDRLEEDNSEPSTLTSAETQTTNKHAPLIIQYQ